MVTSEWGTPDTFENGLVPEILLGSKYGRKLHFWDLHKRKHLQEIDFGEEHQLVFELRPAHDPTKAYGFVNCVISLKDLSSSIWTWYRDGDKWAVKKIITIPAEPADPDDLPPVLKGFKAVPPLVTDIDLSMDDRFLYVSCWGTGDLQQYDVSDPFNPKLTGKVQDRRHRLARRPSGREERQAHRRAADGRDQPRRQARLFHQLALRRDRPAVLRRRLRRLDGEARREARTAASRSTRNSSSNGRRATCRTRSGSRAATARRIPIAIHRSRKHDAPHFFFMVRRPSFVALPDARRATYIFPCVAARFVRSNNSRGLIDLQGAVPDRTRGSGHTAPTYVSRFPGSKTPTAEAATSFASRVFEEASRLEFLEPSRR